MVYLVGVTIPNIWKVIKIPWFQSPPTRKMTSKFWFSCPHHTDQMEWANQSPWHRQTYPRSESAAVPAGGLGNHSFQTTNQIIFSLFDLQHPFFSGKNQPWPFGAGLLRVERRGEVVGGCHKSSVDPTGLLGKMTRGHDSAKTLRLVSWYHCYIYIYMLLL